MSAKSKITGGVEVPVEQQAIARQRLADAHHVRVTEGVGRARHLPLKVVRLLNRASDVVDGVNAAAVLVRESGLMRECGEENMTPNTEDALLKLVIVATDMLTDCFEEAAEWLFDEPATEVSHG